MIILKSLREIERLRKPNSLVASVLKKIVEFASEGMETIELDSMAEAMVRDGGGRPAFKGYKGFPNTLCISINEQVVHGIPSRRKLKNGDLLSVDLGVYLNGYYGDAAVSVGIGQVEESAARLMATAKAALMNGIRVARPGNKISDISNSIQRCVESKGYSVVKAFVGHGIGTSLHEDPQIPNFGEPGRGPLLRNGMVLAIEPMVNIGCSDVNVLGDNWTVVTTDGHLSAHFEHTIAIYNDRVEILTQF